MIIAETTDQTTLYASRYDFIGEGRDQEISRLLEAAQGLLEDGALLPAYANALRTEFAMNRTFIGENRLAAYGLHRTLASHDSGYAAYHMARNHVWGSFEEMAPPLVGSDGLLRSATKSGLELFLDRASAMMGDELEQCATEQGCTTVGYCYALPDAYRDMQTNPPEHLALGYMRDNQFHRVLTRLATDIWSRQAPDEAEAARLQRLLTVTPQFSARPEQYTTM